MSRDLISNPSSQKGNFTCYMKVTQHRGNTAQLIYDNVSRDNDNSLALRRYSRSSFRPFIHRLRYLHPLIYTHLKQCKTPSITSQVNDLHMEGRTVRGEVGNNGWARENRTQIKEVTSKDL